MYEESTNLWDIIIVAAAIAVAAGYLYKVLFKKKSTCGSCKACDNNAGNDKKGTGPF